MKKHIPNILTIVRILSSLIAPYFLIIDNVPVAIILYIASAITDFFDGYLARKFNAFTSLGQVLDPISDKVLALGIVAAGIALGNYLLFSLVIFEFIITFVCALSKYQGLKPYAERVGKVKTAFLFPTVILGLLVNYFQSLQILFIIFLIISLRLEEQAVIAYINQYLYKKNLYQTQKKIEDPLEKSKELAVNDKQNIISEVLNYLFVNIKLVRKGELKNE